MKRSSIFSHIIAMFVVFFCVDSNKGIAQVNNDIAYLTESIDLEAMLDTMPEKSIDLVPVTISFSKQSDFRTPQNISFLTPEVKQQFGRQSIPQILNTTPGLIMHSGAFNTNRITIRGIGNRNLFGTAKIKAYLNDIPLTSGVGETTLEDIDQSLIEDIQVVKGPTSSLYGAGLGGMIHLNTRAKKNNQSSELRFESGIGAYGMQTFVLGGDLNLNDDNRIIANINSTHADGYRNNNDFDRDGFALIGDHTISSKVKLSWIGNYIDLKAQIPSSLNFQDFTENPRLAAFNWQSVNGFEDYKKFILGASAAIQTSEKSTLKVSLFATDFDSYESRPFNILTEDNLAVGARSTYLIQANNKLDLTFGMEAFSERYKWKTFVTNDGIQGDLISDNIENRKYLNLFANGAIDLSNQMHMKFGLNVNTTNYDYEDLYDLDNIDFSGDYSFEPIISPYLSINVKLSNWLFYGLLSHGFSPPTLEETLLPDGQINSDIQPERGLNLEFGIGGQISEWANFKVTAYSMSIRDLLVARRTAADQFVGINAGKTIHNGIEASLGTDWTIGNLDFQFTSDLSLHDYTFKEFIDGDLDHSGNKLTGTPDYVWRSQIQSAYKKFQLGIGFYSLGEQPLRDDNSVSQEGYTIWHTFAQHQMQLSDKLRLDLLVRAENIFDEKYASMLLINAGSFGGRAPRYYYPGLPANLYGSIKLTLKI